MRAATKCLLLPRTAPIAANRALHAHISKCICMYANAVLIFEMKFENSAYLFDNFSTAADASERTYIFTCVSVPVANKKMFYYVFICFNGFAAGPYSVFYLLFVWQHLFVATPLLCGWAVLW